MSTQYASRLITLPNDHGLYPVSKYQPALFSKPGIYRIMSFVSEYPSSPTRIKTRSFYNLININTLEIHLSKLKTEEEILKTRNLHISWINSLSTNAIIIYSDGSRSSTGSIGAGWIIYRKFRLSLETIQRDFCNLGDRMGVFDAELHAVYEGLQCIIGRDICDPGSIYLCIDNSSAIDVLADNPNRIEGAFKTTDAGNTLTKNGWTINTVWIPGHCGIKDNEEADKLAKWYRAESSALFPSLYFLCMDESYG
jgi:ribonuclease HI